jgi:hypothetical protein
MEAELAKAALKQDEAAIVIQKSQYLNQFKIRRRL